MNEVLYNRLIETIADLGRANSGDMRVIRALLPIMRAVNELAEALGIEMNVPVEKQTAEAQLDRLSLDG